MKNYLNEYNKKINEVEVFYFHKKRIFSISINNWLAWIQNVDHGDLHKKLVRIINVLIQSVLKYMGLKCHSIYISNSNTMVEIKQIDKKLQYFYFIIIKGTYLASKIKRKTSPSILHQSSSWICLRIWNYDQQNTKRISSTLKLLMHFFVKRNLYLHCFHMFNYFL